MEKDPLIKTVTDTPGTNRISLRFMLLLPFLVCYYLVYILNFYVTNEWVQYSVKSKLFVNKTYNSSSACRNRNKTSSENVLYEQVESETARWQMLMNIGLHLTGTFSSSILPAYSDCFGRRFILIVGLTGLICKVAISASTVYFGLSPLFMVVGCLADGVAGSYLSVSSGVYSYIADITEHGRLRSFVVTLSDGMLLVCITLSSLGAGYFIEWVGFLIPLLSCFGILVVTFLFLVLLVPESYPKHARSKTRSVCTVFKGTFKFYVSDTFKDQRCSYLCLIITYVFESLANLNRASIEMLYQLGKPFCWSADKIGIFSALRHLTQGFAGMILIKPLQTQLSDVNIAIASMIFGVGSYAFEGLAYTNLMLYIVPLFATFAALCDSMIKSVMSNITPPDKQGSLFASIMVTQGVSAICSNFILNTIYANSVSFMSGLVFFVMGGSVLISVLVLILYSVTQRNKIQSTITEAEINTPKE